MKKSLSFLFLFAALLMGSAAFAQAEQYISLGTAFGVVFGRASYIIPLLLVSAASGYTVYRLIKNYRESAEWGVRSNTILFVAVAAFLFALLYAPTEIAANTTVEMFNRGVIINP